MTEAALAIVCVAAVWVALSYRRHRIFAAWLAGQCCPWCAVRYGDRTVRQAMKSQYTMAKAFAVACGRCQQVQVMTPGGPSIEEFRQRLKLPK